MLALGPAKFGAKWVLSRLKRIQARPEPRESRAFAGAVRPHLQPLQNRLRHPRQSTKPGKEAYVEPVIEARGYRFTIKVGKPKNAEGAKNGTKLARGANFRCLMSGSPIAPDHIYGEATAGRMGTRLMAIVAEGPRERVYLAPTPEHETTAGRTKSQWRPDVAMPENPRWFSPPLYGLKTFGDLFTDRQLERNPIILYRAHNHRI